MNNKPNCTPFLLMDDITSMSLVGSLMALTHSILINLLIKLELRNRRDFGNELNNFTPTSHAKYCFCPRVFSRSFCQGETERHTFFPKNGGPGYEFVEHHIKAQIDHKCSHFGFMCFSFVNMLFF